VVATVAATVAAVPGVEAAEIAHRLPAAGQSHTLTLITGDRLTVTGSGQVGIRPGPGRGHIPFVTQAARGHTSVIPSDALPLLRSGRLDPRLFDVTALIAAGYDDRRADLPLIVTQPLTGAGRSAAPVRPAVPKGLRVVRDLPRVKGVAARLAHVDAPTAWDAIKARGLAATVPTVWLDGVLKPTLDVSVPQIGAPTAWAAGFTGTGVRVAVVDTGIDATHPDLAGKVDAESDFTGTGDASDTVGHGTHVASTIAGTGAASGGRFTGVAPGAHLVDAKVCQDFGCDESAIIAGMEWSVVEQHATIVNMSLGGLDTPGLDPVEQAVQDLSATFGTLFVIAAGNDGADRSIESPGSAAAALTVGAVDSHEALAGFSSRGPAVEDSVLKPDITAPGVGITAARSKDSPLSTEFGSYTTLSGTSMATPHVAGSAAILSQVHPDWTGQQLKATLMASARPNPAIGIYGQGAGRVDVPHAITQTVTTSPASVSFGLQLWPHNDDQPVTKTVTYRNAGPAPVTLNLAVEATGPAAPGTFSLSTTSVTVAAGGQSDVTLTADTRVTGPDGFLGGYVVATAGSTVTRTPFAVEKEVESYNLELVHINRDGQPSVDYFTPVIDLDRGVAFTPYDPDGTVNTRLPKGRYLVHDMIFEGDQVTQLTQPVLVLNGDKRVVLDARTAGAVSARVHRSDATQFQASILFGVPTTPGQFVFGIAGVRFEDLFLGAVGGNIHLDGLITMVKGQWARGLPDGSVDDSPFTYNLAWEEHGRALHGFHRDVRDRDLAQVQARYLSQIPGAMGFTLEFSRFPDLAFGGSGLSAFHTPFSRTEFYTPGSVVWDGDVAEESHDDEGNVVAFVEYLGFGRTFRAGQTYRETWNRPVFGPAFPDGYDPTETGFAVRLGDDLFLSLPLFGDGFGRAGVSAQTRPSSTTLERDGVEIPDQGGVFTVPAEPGDYTLTAVATRGAPFQLSTMVSARWRFRSGHVDNVSLVPLPLAAVHFAPDIDDSGTGRAGRVERVPVTVRAQLGSSATANASLTVAVSYDDGATWTTVPVEKKKGHTVAVLRYPNRSGFVSLRATAADTSGNTVEQTIIRAYRIR
jgi:subtilisin family serine protease